jgi:hypothetical protein
MEKKKIPEIIPDPRNMLCLGCGRVAFHGIVYKTDDAGGIAWLCFACGKVTDID